MRGADERGSVVVRFEVHQAGRAMSDPRAKAQLLEAGVPVLPGERPEVLPVENQDVEGEQESRRHGAGAPDRARAAPSLHVC